MPPTKMADSEVLQQHPEKQKKKGKEKKTTVARWSLPIGKMQEN